MNRKNEQVRRHLYTKKRYNGIIRKENTRLSESDAVGQNMKVDARDLIDKSRKVITLEKEQDG